MREALRIMIGITLGLATLLGGQLAIEVLVWWWSSSTSAFDEPVLNALKFAVAGGAALAVGASIAMQPRGRRRPL